MLFAALTLPFVQASSTPLRPDLNKLLARPQPRQTDFAPARAGWDGPEQVTPEQAANPLMEKYSPRASARAVRASLVAAAIPDPRVVLAIVVAIFAIRRLRKTTLDHAQAADLPPVDEVRPAA